MTEAHTIIWQAIDWIGLEQFTFTPKADVFVGAGQLIGLYENNPYSIYHQVQIDTQWRVRELIIKMPDWDEAGIHLFTDGDGHWQDPLGMLLPELTGCLDVDITLTPFTNTLPIKRLKLLPGQSQRIDVVYVQLPEGRINRVEQIYTRLNADRYRFQQPALEFSADIQVDPAGFVVDYPDLFRRVY
ncbi:putative glycolipid-binding domain-containing protein [Spirosoma knui]